MGSCCSKLECDADESTISCPFGSCRVSHCGCFGSKKNKEVEDKEEKDPIEIEIRVKMAVYEHELRQQIAKTLREVPAASEHASV